MDSDTGWSRAAGESTGRWRTILARASGRAAVPGSTDHDSAPEQGLGAALAASGVPAYEPPRGLGYEQQPGYSFTPPAYAAPAAPPEAAIPTQRPSSGGLEWRATPVDVNPVEQAASVLRRELGGSRVIAFANPKGGVHKTTATVLAAATIGSVRGRGVVAWDDNELRGTLGLRAGSARHARTIRHLVTELAEVEMHTGAELSHRLDDFLRHASDGSYDVLAGEEDSRFAWKLDPQTVRRVLDLLTRTHEIICVDTGNNVESANWQTVMQSADQLVITTVPREDSAFTADWMMDLLIEAGLQELVANAVTLVSLPTPRPSPMVNDLVRHFATRTRAVAVVPYDASLEAGASIEYSALAQPTRQAWLEAAAAIVAPHVR